MLDSASFPLDDWSRQIEDLLGDFDIDGTALSSRALVRRRGVPSARALLHLALARGPGGLSLRQTAAWARLAGIADLTDASLNDRLHQSCDFLGAVAAAMLRFQPNAAAARWTGRSVRIADGTCVSKPGGKFGVSGADWRIHSVYDLGAGGFSHFEVTNGHGAEALDRGAPIAGEIRIGDRGYSNAKAINRFMAAAEGVDFVVRLRWSACKLLDREGAPFDLIDHLQTLPPDRQVDDVPVLIAGGGQPLRARLVIRRKAPEHVAAEVKRLRRMADKNKRVLHPSSLMAAEFVILATSLDAAYPTEEILDLYRLRWQIELGFKRLKSLLHIDKLPAKTERGGLSWLYAHLILAIAVDASTEELLDSFPSGPC
jgi:Transposase DDE domain